MTDDAQTSTNNDAENVQADFSRQANFYADYGFIAIDGSRSNPIIVPGHSGTRCLFGNMIELIRSDTKEVFYKANLPIETNIVLVANLISTIEKSLSTLSKTDMKVETTIYSRATLVEAIDEIEELSLRIKRLISETMVDDSAATDDS